MSLVINSNHMVANVANTLNSHYGRLSTSIQRLSSGLRVNSAADDAAGLAIRELMRSDIAAMNQGVRNANDAISMLQVADGALAIIDEKLIRMKELAEQAATGTYDSTQRLMIDSEFQAMGAEIDRIANATDFNGIKLLDGSLSGAHDGSALNARGALKIHFGAMNDSAEDYYYVRIGDCTRAGLGLTGPPKSPALPDDGNQTPQKVVTLNDLAGSNTRTISTTYAINMENLLDQGEWVLMTNPVGGYAAPHQDNPFFRIKAGTRNIIINAIGYDSSVASSMPGDNDLQLFTATGIHLAGTESTNTGWDVDKNGAADPRWVVIARTNNLPFKASQYDGAYLNTGPAQYDFTAQTLEYSTYNGMTIGYTGDSDLYDSRPQDGILDIGTGYELLTIDEATEDLIVMFPGWVAGYVKAYWDEAPAAGPGDPDAPVPDYEPLTIETQDKAQEALAAINEAIVKKDKIRAHLGALQNRLENTAANLTIQAENLQAAESRISDADVAIEMTNFVRNQILTQSAVAMLSQANSMPQMAMQLIGG